MTLEAGTFKELTIAREVSPHGFFLSADGMDVLLHYSEANGNLAPGEKVRVFLFHDSEDRLAATMKQPLLSLGELALLEVVDVHPRLGCFLDIGLGKHVLLPQSELPIHESERPRIGDKLYAVLTHDKMGRMLARPADETELAKACVRAPESWKNLQVEARVYRTMPVATYVVCDAGVLGFGVLGMIHSSERQGDLRVGELITARVTYVREDGRVNLSMKPRKEASRIEDADKIERLLEERPNGGMPYSDDSPAEIIAKKFGMSKAAFKRALGKLIKEGKIEQRDGWTYLKK